MQWHRKSSLIIVFHLATQLRWSQGQLPRLNTQATYKPCKVRTNSKHNHLHLLPTKSWHHPQSNRLRSQKSTICLTKLARHASTTRVVMEVLSAAARVVAFLVAYVIRGKNRHMTTVSIGLSVWVDVALITCARLSSNALRLVKETSIATRTICSRVVLSGTVAQVRLTYARKAWKKTSISVRHRLNVSQQGARMGDARPMRLRCSRSWAPMCWSSLSFSCWSLSSQHATLPK